jgi:hypothetical protein
MPAPVSRITAGDRADEGQVNEWLDKGHYAANDPRPEKDLSRWFPVRGAPGL